MYDDEDASFIKNKNFINVLKIYDMHHENNNNSSKNNADQLAGMYDG